MKQEEFIPLGCTFRDLLLSCDPVEVATKAALKDLETHIESRDPQKKDSIDFLVNQLVGYDASIREILSYDSPTSRVDGWAVSSVPADEFTDFDWINVSLYNWDYVKPPKKLTPAEWSENKYWRTFSSSFASWSEHADREIMVTQKALDMCRSLSDLAAEIMWEATFSGFSGNAVKARGDQILGECKEAMDAYRAEHPIDGK